MKTIRNILIAIAIMVAFTAAPALASTTSTSPTTPCGISGMSYYSVSNWTVHVHNDSATTCKVIAGAYDMHGHNNLQEGDQSLIGVPSPVLLAPGGDTELSVSGYNGACRIQRDVVSVMPTDDVSAVMPTTLTNSNQGQQYNALVKNSQTGGQAQTINNEGGLCPTPLPSVSVCASSAPLSAQAISQNAAVTRTLTAELNRLNPQLVAALANGQSAKAMSLAKKQQRLIKKLASVVNNLS